MATVFRIFHALHFRLGQKAYFLFPLLWISFEFLHINWEFSWPWLTLGNGFAGYHHLIQWYEFTGVLGGSLWVLSLNVLIFLFLQRVLNGEVLNAFMDKQFRSIFILILLPCFGSLVIYYTYKEDGEERNVVIVQPNLDPYNEKFVGNTDEDVRKMLLLAQPTIEAKTDFLILPETAIAREMRENEISDEGPILLVKNFGAQFPNLNILCGVSTYRIFEETEERTEASRDFKDGNGFYESYNTAMFTDTGSEIKLYHKSKLVLGVEKIPYRDFFQLFERFTIDLGGTSGSLGTQKERTVFHSAAGNLGPIICYESIYGDFLRGFIENGADFFAIITNDGWWGDTPGYKQHLLLGGLRAIEFRRSIVRSANTGISCIINQRGDVLLASNYWEPSIVKGTFRLNETKTMYARLGDYIGWISVLGLFLTVLNGLVRKRKLN